MSQNPYLVDAAPDFGRDYPSKGVLIGPAWQLAWDYLGKVDGATTAQLVAVMRPAGVVDQTASNLLRAARKQGLLTVDYVEIKKRKNAVYRRA